jgi:hypothetical protein
MLGTLVPTRKQSIKTEKCLDSGPNLETIDQNRKKMFGLWFQRRKKSMRHNSRKAAYNLYKQAKTYVHTHTKT